MGLYTWVSKYCCDSEIQFQSKACQTMEWGEHDLRDVPVEVAKSITGEVEVCSHCGKRYRVQVLPRDVDNVQMEIVEI